MTGGRRLARRFSPVRRRKPSVRRGRRQIGTVARLALAAAALTASVPGCEGPAMLAHWIAPDTVPARYELPPRPTVVLVDDPAGLLGRRELASMIANEATFHLERNIDEIRMVPTARLREVEARLGEDFATTPIDRVGLLAGAELVVHAEIERVRWTEAPGLWRPRVDLRVKLIDAEAGQRLFPRGEASTEPTPTVGPHGALVQVKMGARTVPVDDRGAVDQLKRRLAGVLGLEIAQVFYDHEPRNPMQDYED